MGCQKRRSQGDGKWPENKWLAPELWTEIFARLPVATLLRFRCVCKQWRSIIDSSYFIYSKHLKLYKNNFTKPNILVMETIHPAKLYGYGDRGSTFTIRTRLNFRKLTQRVRTNVSYHIVGSCQGLLLLSRLNLRVNGHLNSITTMLCNPSIRKALTLPPCPILDVVKGVLGFVSSCNDFRVVIFKKNDEDDEKLSSSIAVYSLNDDTWTMKTIKLEIPVAFDLTTRYVYLKGAAYWMVYKYNGKEYNPCPFVYSFDFSTEELSYVKLPDSPIEMAKHLFVLGESLAIFGVSPNSSCVWIMSKDGGDNDDDDNNNPWSVWSVGGSSENSYDIFKSYRNTLVSYDEKSGTFLAKLSSVPWSRGLSLGNITSCQVERFGKDNRGCTTYVDTFEESLVFSRPSQGQTLISFP